MRGTENRVLGIVSETGLLNAEEERWVVFLDVPRYYQYARGVSFLTEPGS